MEEVTIQNPVCSQCNLEIVKETKFCANCGFPENGEEKEKAIFHANKVMKKNEVIDNQKKIKSARNTLYWMAGISFVYGLFYFIRIQDSASLIIQTIISMVYLVLAYWSQKKPFAALLSGLLLYLTIIATLAIVEPTSISSGIIFKIIIITFLSKGVYSASQSAK